MKDIEKAFNALTAKQLIVGKKRAYYEGDQPLVYSAERLREAFQDKFTRFNQNWCAVVVDSTLDRISLEEFDVLNNTGADDLLDAFWSENDVSLDADEIHRDALICGESYVIVWKNTAGEIELYYNPALMCHLFYQSDNPKIKSFGAKWFKGDQDELWHLTLYYADRLEYYVSNSKDLPSAAGGFKNEKANAKNPFGVIPVFQFRCPSELRDILTVQDAVNKIFADMMVASEFSAFKQRWVISNSDLGALKNAPNEIWNVPAGDGVGQQTSVGEFEGEDLTKFLSAIDKLANYVSIVTRTPKNYLTEVGAGISGDALIAMEAPLVKKVGKRIKAFSKTWKEIAAFMLLLDGKTIAKRQILPVWDRVRSEQPLAEMQAINFGVSSGLPLKTMMRWQGKSKAEIAQVEKDQIAEKKATSSMAQTLLDNARTNQDQNNNPGYVPTPIKPGQVEPGQAPDGTGTGPMGPGQANGAGNVNGK